MVGLSIFGGGKMCWIEGRIEVECYVKVEGWVELN